MRTSTKHTKGREGQKGENAKMRKLKSTKRKMEHPAEKSEPEGRA